MTHTLAIVLVLLIGQVDEPTITVADLKAYREALEASHDEAPNTVDFRALWDHAEDYRDRYLRVEGRVVRRFQQPSVGTFPPLTELWVVTASRDPLCLVFPTPEDPAGPGKACEPGASVRFDGTFLKLIRYAGGDESRIAPLIVGPRPPVRREADPLAGTGTGSSFAGLDWVVGLIVAGLVIALLLRQALARPTRRPVEPAGPRPHFLDADNDDHDDDDQTEGPGPEAGSGTDAETSA